MSDELPSHLRERVEKLRRNGGPSQLLVEKLLGRRAAGSPEEQRQVDELLAKSGKRSVWRMLFPALLVLPIAGLLGYHAYSEHDYEQAVAGSWLTVSVERTDPQRVYFDARSMAVEAPQPPPSAR